MGHGVLKEQHLLTAIEKHNNYKAVKAILQSNNDIEKNSRRSPPLHENYQDHKKGQSSLRRACRHGNLETVILLIQHGVDVNLRDHAGGTPLHMVWSVHRAKYLVQKVLT